MGCVNSTPKAEKTQQNNEIEKFLKHESIRDLTNYKVLLLGK
jgi:hypothetical protein